MASPSSAPPRGERGFTLIELLVVVVIIGILATVGFQYLAPRICAGHLTEASTYTLRIASKMRAYKVEQGTYYSVAGATLDEQDLEDNLGLDLKDGASFCFVTICKSASACAAVTTPAYITASETGDDTTEFEVWAILREAGTTTVGGPNGVSCTVVTDKRTSTGWVKPSISTDTCREGQAVVHRYPPPPNGLDTITGAASVAFDWLEGTTISHVMKQ